MVSEIVNYFTETFNSQKYLDWLENFLMSKINEGKRTYSFENKFWQYHSGCSGTHFKVGFKTWENEPKDSTKYNGIDLSTIQKPVIDGAISALKDTLKREGIRVVGEEDVSGNYRYNYYTVQLTIDLEDFDESSDFEESKNINEEGMQVDNIPSKNDQGRRIELAKLENEGKVSYRVSYLNEADEEIVGWDIDAEDDEDAMNKLDAFSDADEIADDIINQEFVDSGVDGVASLFYRGANVNLAVDDNNYMITIDKDGEEPVILNGSSVDEVISSLILYYIMNSEDPIKAVDAVDEVKDAAEDIVDTEPARDLEKSEQLEEQNQYSVTANIPDDLLDDISDFDPDNGTYKLKGEYANLSFVPDEDAKIGDYDDEQPFIISGDQNLVDRFASQYGSLHEGEDQGNTSIEVELPEDFLEEETEYDQESDTYKLKGEFSSLKLTYIDEPRETNYDDTEFFTVEGNSKLISKFLDTYDSRDNI